MSKKRPLVAYVGPFSFPEGGAAARRILGNAKAIVEAGYDVVIVSGQAPDELGVEFDVAPGIRCVRTSERVAEHLPRAVRYLRYIAMGSNSRKWLDAQPRLPDYVVIYSGYSPYLLQFTRWAKRRNVALLFDAVEWYTASSFLRFVFSPYLWNTELAMRVLIPRLDGALAISRALQDYYQAHQLPVCRVPPLFDPDELQPGDVSEFGHQRPLRLVYSGSPGQKDLLGVVIEAVVQANQKKLSVTLDIVGISQAELLALLVHETNTDQTLDIICAHGRVPHRKSIDIVRQSDFTVFLRDQNRVSTHGFPTKFVESLALGTPVLTNLTSDLADHLRDQETGLICPDATSDALLDAIERACTMDSVTKRTMRDASREEALRSFSFRQHVKNFATLFEKIRKIERREHQ